MSTTSGPDSGTTAMTTMVPEPTTGTPTTTTPLDEGTSTAATETAADTTMGVVDPTTDGSSSNSGGEGESSSSGEPPECMNDDGCESNQICTNDRCVDACGEAWGAGSYGYCLTDFGTFDTAALCGEGHLCVYWNGASGIEQTACALQGCEDACDCPPPPPTGNAVVTCGEITNPVGANDCYLSCAGGETCPDGMTCNAGGVCTALVSELSVYGDCGNVAASCALPGYCIDIPAGDSSCTMPCTDVSDCPVTLPSGGTAVPACEDLVPSRDGLECFLDCSGGASCPDDMTCINGARSYCMWPPA